VSQLRVISYNIHKGSSPANLGSALPEMRAAISSLGADLVLLQEVMGSGRARGESEDPQFEFLAESIWPHFAYGKNAVYTGGHHGNAILSKHPIVYWENEDVSKSRMERRGLLHAAIKAPGFSLPLHAICLHLSLFESTRQAQLEDLARRVRKVVPEGAPLVIGGDFNDWREKASAFLEKELGCREAHFGLKGEHARTFPGWLPLLRLDRIYLRGLRCLAAQAPAGKPWSELSDHLPLTAELSAE
jgi:endonuclease/exonuclease/phosphatase family metal-dependent hydrolase